MRKPAIALAAFTFINLSLVLFYSCGRNSGTDCGKGGPHYQCVNMTTLEAGVYAGEERRSVNANETVSAKDAGIQAIFVGSGVICRSKPERNPFIQAAYACSPVINFRSKDPVATIVITSDSTFDGTHPAGISLNEYFEIPEISELNKLLTYEQGSYQDSLGVSLQYFKLKQAPAVDGIQKFSVTVNLLSGTTYKAECQPVRLKK